MFDASGIHHQVFVRNSPIVGGGIADCVAPFRTGVAHRLAGPDAAPENSARRTVNASCTVAQSPRARSSSPRYCALSGCPMPPADNRAHWCTNGGAHSCTVPVEAAVRRDSIHRNLLTRIHGAGTPATAGPGCRSSGPRAGARAPGSGDQGQWNRVRHTESGSRWPQSAQVMCGARGRRSSGRPLGPCPELIGACNVVTAAPQHTPHTRAQALPSRTQTHIRHLMNGKRSKLYHPEA